jgi:hypothetical protein
MLKGGLQATFFIENKEVIFSSLMALHLPSVTHPFSSEANVPCGL